MVPWTSKNFSGRSQSPADWTGSLTDGVGFAEMTSDHVVHVVVLAQVELQQVNLDLTVFDKHAVFDNLGDGGESERGPLHTAPTATRANGNGFYLPHDGSLTVKAAVPTDKLGPCVGRYQNIVQLIYKVLFQGLSLLI